MRIAIGAAHRADGRCKSFVHILAKLLHANKAIAF